ncbi:2OG-Fe dioxygenase family protein [Bartonella krasnovii]|uniref:2OG-Fe dioxygenase family protein n=1 Tax=Bartonella krasnovii TaxID=2267275 RepID=UPI0034E946C0
MVYVAKKGIQGNCTPKEIYKDCHTFVSMHMIDRYNIEGSKSYIYDENRNKRDRFERKLREYTTQ